MKDEQITELLEAHSDLFIGFPDESALILMEIFIERHRNGLDYSGIYELLAFKLLEKKEIDFPVDAIFQHTPLKKIRSASVSLLSLFYSDEDIKYMIYNPNYEPDTYALLSPQDKTVVEIAKMMLSSIGSTKLFDYLTKGDQEFRKEIYRSTMGKFAWAGMKSAEVASKPRPTRKENTAERHEIIAMWAEELYEHYNGEKSWMEIAEVMADDDLRWRKEHLVPLKKDRIYKIIKNFSRIVK